MSDARRTAQLSSTEGFEQVLERLITKARVDPARVVAEAHRRGLPTRGRGVGEHVWSLRLLPPEALDPLARSFVHRGSVGAGVQGVVTNIGGVASLPFALPADTVGALWWIVRATSGVMTAYGFESESAEGAAQLRLGLLAATGVNAVAADGTRVVVEQLSRQLLANPAAQQLITAGTRKLASRLAANSARGRLTRAVPVVGGAVGGAVNVAMVEAVGRRTRRHYRSLLVDWQQRRQGQLVVVPPPPVAAPSRLELPAGDELASDDGTA